MTPADPAATVALVPDSPETALRSDSTAEGLFETLQNDDLTAAAGQLGTLLMHGVDAGELIDDVLRPVMVEVGLRWEHNQWTTAQEHGATATVDAALASVETRFLSTPADGHPIVVACAEGEWHNLPARLAAVRLRAEGHRVLFLGPSLPPEHLAHHLQRVGALALGLSCTLPVHLPGARRCINAAHAVGVPVLVGGAAFDPAGCRAAAIGADCVSGSPDIVAFLASPTISATTPSRDVVRNRREAFDVEIAIDGIVSAAIAEIALRYPPFRGFDRSAFAQIRDDLTWTVKYCAAAIDIADPSVLLDHVEWKRRALSARGVPVDLVAISLESLAIALRPQFPRAAQLIRRSSVTG